VSNRKAATKAGHALKYNDLLVNVMALAPRLPVGAGPLADVLRPS